MPTIHRRRLEPLCDVVVFDVAVIVGRGSTKGRRDRWALTIIELIAVIVILTILGTVATVAVGGWTSRRSVALASDRLASMDAAARRAAVRTGGAEVRVGAFGVSGGGRSLPWPGGVRLLEVGLWDREPVADLTVRLDSRGRGPTYRVVMEAGGVRRRFVVIGISGQLVDVGAVPSASDFGGAGVGLSPPR